MDNETCNSEEQMDSTCNSEEMDNAVCNSELSDTDTLSADEEVEPNRKRQRTFLDECHDDDGDADDIVEEETEEDADFIDDRFLPPSPYVPLPPQRTLQPTLEETAGRLLNNAIAEIEQRETPSEAPPTPATFTWVPTVFTPMLQEIYDHAIEQLGDSADVLDKFWLRMDARYKLVDSDRLNGYGLPPECHGMTENAAVLWLSDNYPFPVLRYIGRELWGRAEDGAPHFPWGQPVTGSPKLKAYAYEWADMYGSTTKRAGKHIANGTLQDRKTKKAVVACTTPRAGGVGTHMVAILCDGLRRHRQGGTMAVAANPHQPDPNLPPPPSRSRQ